MEDIIHKSTAELRNTCRIYGLTSTGGKQEILIRLNKYHEDMELIDKLQSLIIEEKKKNKGIISPNLFLNKKQLMKNIPKVINDITNNIGFHCHEFKSVEQYCFRSIINVFDSFLDAMIVGKFIDSLLILIIKNFIELWDEFYITNIYQLFQTYHEYKNRLNNTDPFKFLPGQLKKYAIDEAKRVVTNVNLAFRPIINFDEIPYIADVGLSFAEFTDILRFFGIEMDYYDNSDEHRLYLSLYGIINYIAYELVFNDKNNYLTNKAVISRILMDDELNEMIFERLEFSTSKFI